jgi:hypothetical protein
MSKPSLFQCLCLIATLSMGGCSALTAPTSTAAERGLDDIPVPSGFARIKRERSGATGRAVASDTYRSSASFADVKMFYVRELCSDGWIVANEFDLETVSKSEGAYKIEMTKGQERFVVEYAGQTPYGNWNYLLVYSAPT